MLVDLTENVNAGDANGDVDFAGSHLNELTFEAFGEVLHRPEMVLLGVEGDESLDGFLSDVFVLQRLSAVALKETLLLRQTYLIRKHPANVTKIVPLKPIVGEDLHPAAQSLNAFRSNNRFRISIPVNEHPVEPQG